MTIRHLNVFIKVADLLNVSKAAEELHISQPSVSQTIKELEDYYGVILFNRANKKISLTNEGLLLLKEARDVIVEFEEFESLAKKDNLNTTLKVGATMTFGAFVIPKFYKLVKEQYPNANVYFYIDKPIGLQEKVLKGEIDFAFEEGNVNVDMLKTHQIGNDELIAICAPDYNAPDKLNIVDLVNYDLLLRETGNPSRRLLDYQLIIRGIKVPQPRLESISNNVILSMTMAGNGIGILPQAIARRFLQSGQIRQIQLDVPLKRKLFVITHKNKVFNRTSAKIFDLALNILK